MTDTPKSDFKYLAIRNWTRFQATTDKNGKSLDGRPRPYIRDYTDKETDSQYAALSVVARYLFDACRRLRGKTGRNLPNDHMWILRQLDVDPTERGRCTHALQSLIRRGLLIPTNQPLDIPQAAETSLDLDVESRGRRRDTSIKPPAEPGEQDNNPRIFQINEDEVELPKSKAFEIED